MSNDFLFPALFSVLSSLGIPMEKRISDEEVDKDLAAKLTAPGELEGLLVRAVDGLRRLMERGSLTPL